MARTVEVNVAGGSTIEGSPLELTLAHSYSNRRWTIGPFDDVVLACGSVPNDSIYHELRALHPDVRLLGDAYAPRRMVFATRQAWQLALDLD
jgi:hypothetical protein